MKNKMNKTKLKEAWETRRKLRAEARKHYAEASKLWAEASKLRAEGDKHYAEADKLRVEGDNLWAEADKLRVEGDNLWAEAILKYCGDIKTEWKNWNKEKRDFECHLENGLVFKP